MAKFPELSSVVFASPIQQSIEYKTLISQFDGIGEEKRRQKWLFPRRNIVVQYKNISKEEIETLWAFYLERKGAFEEFNFFWPEPLSDYPSYVNEFVGVGDGSTQVFNLPCKYSSSRTIYVNSVTMNDVSDYSFAALGGTDGADKISFTTAPEDGAFITMDFSGILKVRCRFAEDNLSFDLFYDKVANTGIQLKGLLNQ